MSYFNHAFKKTMLGDKGYYDTHGGKLGTPGSTPGKGEFVFVDQNWTTIAVDDAPSGCCPLTLVAGSVLDHDKIGAFHGGYLETNKSKVINPKYVHKFYRVDACAAQNNIVAVGYTTETLSLVVGTVLTITSAGGLLIDGTYTGVEIDAGSGSGVLATIVIAGNVLTSATITSGGVGVDFGGNWTISDTVLDAAGAGISIPPIAGTFTSNETTGATDCCQEFLCGENYHLRVDIKGEGPLEALAHNAYLELNAYAGCCADPSVAPVPVDSTLIYIEWANQLITSPIMTEFVQVVVTAEDNSLWYAPGTDTTAIVAPIGFTIGGTWDNYVSPGHTVDECAGMLLSACYVSTKFGDCSFQYLDGYDYQPLKIYVSEVDLNGDPCLFTGVCVHEVCAGLSPQGLGETAARDLILSEAYGQNSFATDVRIREITQGDDMLTDGAGNRIRGNDSWIRYYLLHTVPRYNNPSGVFDNDQYLIEILATSGLDMFENFVNAWLDDCNCVQLEVISCKTECAPILETICV